MPDVDGVTVRVVVVVGVVVTAPLGVTTGVPVGVSVRADVRVTDGVGTGVTDADADGEDVDVTAGVVVIAGVDDDVPVLAGVTVTVNAEEPVMDADNPCDREGVLEMLEAAVTLLLAVEDADDVDDAVDETVVAAVLLGVRAGVVVTTGVCVGDVETDGVCDGDRDAEEVEVLEQLYTGATEYGAAVTPRNTVLAGAVARVVATSATVSYEYSLVAEVA